ncbi:MAG TPA: CvpA family protein [Ktedonobacteraceae bacterium]|nr:CvpA family protein [Ktedonobacteraceae bacterium]
MPTSFNWIDILFLVTVVLLVINGFKNGAVFSLINLLSIPLGVIVVIMWGPQFVKLLSANGLTVAPIIAYIILFFAAVIILHIIGSTLHGVIRRIPLVGFGDELLGGVIGFAEAWLLWVILLAIVGNFLQSAHNLPGGISITQFSQWQSAYNYTVTHSLFAQVNSFIIKSVPLVKH